MRYTRQLGFTLIELLVAIAIFSSLSIGAYQILDGVLRSNQHNKHKLERLNELQRAMLLIEDDFRQITPLTGRVESTQQIGFIAAPHFNDSEDGGIAFIRSGWRNPGARQPRSELTRVGYRLQNNQLQRLFYLYPDPVINAETKIMDILSDVTAFKLRFYGNGGWQKQWPTRTQKIPTGVEISLTLKDLGEIRRVFVTIGASL